MCKLGAICLLAFPGGSGTADCVARAIRYGIDVWDAWRGEGTTVVFGAHRSPA
jgi:hypothetical protein